MLATIRELSVTILTPPLEQSEVPTSSEASQIVDGEVAW
jgi:hypothetical protein